MTAFISAMVEAWSELRIHKTRVLLALLGVALSVAVLTTVVGVGNLARRASGWTPNATAAGRQP